MVAFWQDKVTCLLLETTLFPQLISLLHELFNRSYIFWWFTIKILLYWHFLVCKCSTLLLNVLWRYHICTEYTINSCADTGDCYLQIFSAWDWGYDRTISMFRELWSFLHLAQRLFFSYAFICAWKFWSSCIGEVCDLFTLSGGAAVCFMAARMVSVVFY